MTSVTWWRMPNARPAPLVRPRTRSRWSDRKHRPDHGPTNPRSPRSASSKISHQRSARHSARPRPRGTSCTGTPSMASRRCTSAPPRACGPGTTSHPVDSELTGRSPDGSRSGWSGQSTHTFVDVDVAAHATDVARRLDWAQRRIDLPAGRYDTLLPPSAVADLMVYLHWSSGALDSADGRTGLQQAGRRHPPR